MVILIIGICILIAFLGWACCKVGADSDEIEQEIHNELKYEKDK